MPTLPKLPSLAGESLIGGSAPGSLPIGLTSAPLLPTSGTGQQIGVGAPTGSDTGSISGSAGSGSFTVGGLPSGFQATAAALQAQGCAWYDVICLGKSQLTRLILLILGIVCIIGAIYLYKPASNTILAPVRTAARHAVSAIAESAEA